MSSILVTGGVGFIGSHTCIYLLNNGYKVYIIDSLINSSIHVIDLIEKICSKSSNFSKGNLKFFKGDICDERCLERIFLFAKKENRPIQSVIHFAGLKSVKDSTIDPIRYWEVNVSGSINLLHVMRKYGCNTIVFSSSATIYGSSKYMYIPENSKIKPVNPYGNTKSIIEKLLSDTFHNLPNWKIASLRYFNPIGAHPSGLLGENPKGSPNNIFPIITQVASRKKDKLSIFGRDWSTKDGTGVRDYIHVMDLAEGHVRTLDYLKNNNSMNISMNIGTSKGTSVLELIDIFQKVNNIEIPHLFESRREGDVARLVADNSLLKRTLDWCPKRSLEEMCVDGWNWQKLNPNGLKI